MVLLHTGTNFPAVSVNSLLAVAMMETRQRWNGTGVPTQSQPQTASLTVCAWNTHIYNYANGFLDKCNESTWAQICLVFTTTH
jgi:hypothetical protein